ncbi:MAG TPA: hypothetical protein VMA75_01160 [Candidatus Paceibacterota bacterium]|nr:hypothetical protein [Candidatus Paceibacterota bacterium]
MMKKGYFILAFALTVVACVAVVMGLREKASATGITFVQAASSTSEYNSGPYSSASAQFTGSVTTGNMIVVIIQYGKNSNYYGGMTSNDVVTGCSDTNNGTSSYREAIDAVGGGYNGIDLWYATNVTGGAAPTVTCTINPAVGNISMGIAEYSGVAASSALDTATFINDSPTSTSWSSGSATTQSSGDLIIGGFEAPYQTLTFTPASGFTKRIDQGGSTGLMMEDTIQSSAGSIAAAATSSVAVVHQEAFMAAFRPAGASLPSGIRWIQNANNIITNGVNPTTTFINPVTTGDTIVVGLSYGDATTGITGCSDTYDSSSSYHLAAATSSVPAFASIDVWYAANVTGGANDTVTCTVASGHSIYAKIITASEYAGIATSSPLDTTSASYSSASTTFFTTGTSTTSHNGDLVFGMISHLTDDNTDFLTPGSGYTVRANNTGSGAEDMVQTSAGPVSAYATNSESDTYLGVLAAFVPANGVSSPSYASTPYTEILSFGW